MFGYGHRTAGPDHDSGSSGPMIPRPLYARITLPRKRAPSSHNRTRSQPRRSWFVCERKLIRLDHDLWSPEGRSPERSEGEWVVRISMSAFHPKADVDWNASDV